MRKKTISWLLEGDVSIQYQVYRDLMGKEKTSLRKRIESEGWGLRLINRRQANGHWGKGFYQPKWTSSHYTLLDLKNLCISPANKAIKGTLKLIFEKEKASDGGINPIGSVQKSDVCINGMLLNYACYFNMKETDLKSVVDFLLGQQMKDGGFNCQSNRKGAVHSSLHSTLSVVEGIWEYEKSGYGYRLDELKQAAKESHEFILMHRLFRSDKTGEIINPAFLRLCYPWRWHYDILRALDYFQFARVKYDVRMEEAMEVILSKRTGEGLWKLASPYSGETHFEMEKPGKPSRWNSLRALRVLQQYSIRS